MRRLLLALSAMVVILVLRSPQDLNAMMPCQSLYVCQPSCGWDPADMCEMYRPNNCYVVQASCSTGGLCTDPLYQALYACSFANY